MHSKEEILAKIKEVLSKEFDIDEAKITPDAHLFHDLDLDSIDAVDLVVAIQKVTGKKMAPEQFSAVRTIDDVANTIFELIKE